MSRSGNPNRRAGEWLRHAIRELAAPTTKALALRWGQTHPEQIARADNAAEHCVARIRAGLHWLENKGYAERWRPPGSADQRWRLTVKGEDWAFALDEENDRLARERAEA